MGKNVKSSICGLIVFKAHLWPLIVLKPQSIRVNGLSLLAPDVLRPTHVEMGNHIKRGGRWYQLTEAPMPGIVE